VFGYDGYYAKHKVNKEIIGHIVLIGSTGYELFDQFRIIIKRPAAGPSPFSVVDLDPWSDNVLLVDIRDSPHGSRWLVYDMVSHIQRDIGYARTYGFFLARDVFGAR